MSDSISVDLPKDILDFSGLSKDEIVAKSQLFWYFELYSTGKITLSKASQLSGLNIDKFLEEFQSRRFRHIGGPQTIEEANEDLNTIDDII
ncbi:MAG: UPF0175 family protein [Candidatus Hodarchaeales archaeon]